MNESRGLKVTTIKVAAVITVHIAYTPSLVMIRDIKQDSHPGHKLDSRPCYQSCLRSTVLLLNLHLLREPYFAQSGWLLAELQLVVVHHNHRHNHLHILHHILHRSRHHSHLVRDCIRPVRSLAAGWGFYVSQVTFQVSHLLLSSVAAAVVVAGIAVVVAAATPAAVGEV